MFESDVRDGGPRSDSDTKTLGFTHSLDQPEDQDVYDTSLLMSQNLADTIIGGVMLALRTPTSSHWQPTIQFMKSTYARLVLVRPHHALAWVNHDPGR